MTSTLSHRAGAWWSLLTGLEWESAKTGVFSPFVRQTDMNPHSLITATLLLVPLLGATQTNHSFVIAIGETPIITDHDIIEYRFAEHAMTIKGESLKRLLDVHPKSLSGTSFRVLADGVSVYSGLFVPGDSSMTYSEPTIWLGRSEWLEQETATVYIGGPHFQEPQFQNGKDPRGDVRITTALGALGNLKPGFAGGVHDRQALTGRMAEILKECQQIKPGSTRADLLKVFTTEGGISNARQRTYVHRDCPYIKVDVRFNLTDEKQSVVLELPTDKVSSISQPYLNWSIMD